MTLITLILTPNHQKRNNTPPGTETTSPLFPFLHRRVTMQLGETFWAADSPVSFERLAFWTEKLFLARGGKAKQGLGWRETVAEEGGGGEKKREWWKKKFIHKPAGPAKPLLPALPSTPFRFPTHLSVSITSFVPSVAPGFSVLLMAPLLLLTKG